MHAWDSDVEAAPAVMKHHCEREQMEKRLDTHESSIDRVRDIGGAEIKELAQVRWSE